MRHLTERFTALVRLANVLTMIHLTSLALIPMLAAQPQEPSTEAPSQAGLQQQKWNEFYAREAAGYVIRLDGGSELQLQREAVLFWSNPVRGGETNGAVFVWTHNGRAELVGTVFSYLVRDMRHQKHIAHSFHSLSREPLMAERDGEQAWTAAEAGIEPQPIPDAPPPATSRTLRLTQMRRLADEFRASTELDGVQQELRLLPQPLYRNTQSAGTVLDGALFTFVTGTDPELILQIEARDTRDEGPVWHYATGRFTDLPLTLRHGNRILWTREYVRGDPRDLYFTTRISIRPKIMP